MADAGGMSKGSESNAGGTGMSATRKRQERQRGQQEHVGRASRLLPPRPPALLRGGASAPPGGSSQVVDDHGNVVAPPVAKDAESNAGGAGTSATNAAAANTSAGNTSATGSGAAPAGSSGSVPAQTLAAATPEALRQVDDYGNVVSPPSAKIAESNAGGAAPLRRTRRR